MQKIAKNCILTQNLVFIKNNLLFLNSVIINYIAVKKK